MNQRPNAPPGSPLDWLGHAENDLTWALFGSEKDFLSKDIACFHAQQAAKKALKAVLKQNHVEIPFSHDLHLLTQACQKSKIALPIFYAELDTLTPYAVSARYPDAPGEPNPERFHRIMELAKLTVAWAKTAVA